MRAAKAAERRDSTRFRVVSTLGAAFLFFMVAFAAIFVTNMLMMLYHGEDEQIRVKSGIVMSAVETSMAAARAVTEDWASRDGSYSYAVGGNPTHFSRHWDEDWKISGQMYNFLYVKDLSGNDTYVKFYDYFLEEDAQPPEGFSEFLSALGQDMLASFGEQRAMGAARPEGKDGIAFYGGVPYYISSRPILTSDGQSGPAGMIFFGRIMNEQEFRRITGDFDLAFSVADASQSVGGDGILRDGDMIYSLAPIKSFYGGRPAYLKIGDRRRLHNSGVAIIVQACLMMAAAVLLFAGIVYWLLQKHVLRNIENLCGDIEKSVKAAVPIRLRAYSGSREFSMLASSVNGMFMSLSDSRETLRRTTVSRQTMESVLNSLDICLLVNDLESCQVLFVNKKMREYFKIPDGTIGRPSYEVLGHCYDSKEGFCPKLELGANPRKIVSAEFQHAYDGRYYKQFDMMIDWVGVKNAHLLYLIDITATKQAEATLKKRLDQEALVSAVSSGFISERDIGMFMNKALESLGQYMNVSRAVIARYDGAGKVFELQAAWAGGGEDVDDLLGTKLKLGENTPMFEVLVENYNGYFALSDTSADTAYEHVKRFGIKSLLAVPLYVSGGLWGMLELDGPRVYDWTGSDIRFTRFVANLIAGAVAREDAARELMRATADAEQASRAKSDFLSRMSHEMRTPMNAVIGMAAIAKSTGSAERKAYCLDRIDDASKHLLSIINDILDMSKIEAGKFELSHDKFDIRCMINNVVTMLDFRADTKKLNISVSVGGDTPELITGDETRLSQVIMNLMSNAIKFTPENGSVSLKVEKTGEDGTAHLLRIEVEDTGIGISPEQRGRLFNSFEQADSSIARRFGGTGLGLAISKRIVGLMGGEIWVESELGKGSRFIFTMKAGKCGDGGQSAAGVEAAPIDSFEGKALLVAEDIDINREIVAFLLEDTGIEVDFAENGRQAVEAFARNPEKYDMIFMDIQMPEMDGYQATREIRALGGARAGSIPIVAMTANAFTEDIEQCLKAGMNDHIGKPLDVGVLNGKLRRYLG